MHVLPPGGNRPPSDPAAWPDCVAVLPACRYGDGLRGAPYYSDSVRQFLSPTAGDVDVDICVPSVTLPTLMVRWMVVFAEQDADTLALFRTAPRRFFRPSATKPSSPSIVTKPSSPSIVTKPSSPSIVLADAPTRYGAIDANLTAVADAATPECTESARASVEMRLHGRGYVGAAGAVGGGLTVEVRLRAHGGGDCISMRRLATASVEGGTGLGKYALVVDRETETVALQLATRLPRGRYNFAVVGGFH